MEGQTEEASISHGTKRRADDNLEHEQRLTKRFNLLNLGENYDQIIASLFIS